ncbi:cellulose biosynthesis protein BcsP [Xylophilus sp. GW821-FHT01B05]
MSQNDIVNLFKQFGGKASQYQEIARENQAQQSHGRWPLLSALDAASSEPPAPVAETPPAAPAGAAALFANRPAAPLRAAPAPAAAPQDMRQEPLQQVFARLSRPRPPEPAPASGDELSLLRKLLSS